MTRIQFTASFSRPNRCIHGPQTWRWWHVFSVSLIKLRVQAPTTGWRLWIYTRWWAYHFDIYFVRREDPK